MENLYLFLISVLPTLGLLFFFIYSDRFIEPKKTVLQTLLLGMFIIAPLQIVHTFIDIVLGTQFEFGPFLTAFFQASFLEEFFKFCVLFYFCSTFTHFNEPMDGLVYGITASLGFALYENIEYVYFAEDFDQSLAIAYGRAFTAVPSHAFDGVIMGFFLGRYFFDKEKNKSNLYLSLTIPVLLHGFYDWVLMEDKFNNNFMYLVMAIELILVVYLYRKLKDEQNKKQFEAQKKFR